MSPSERFERPEWWEWELAFTAHVEARMEERGFSEVDLREMLEDALDLEQSRNPRRWLVRTRSGGAPWIVVVEPDPDEQVLLIVTAYLRDARR